jgi:hypothetical protein
MGTKNFFTKHAMPTQGMNMAARAFGSGSYAARSAGMRAEKDLGAAMAAGTHGLKNTVKDAASNAPGPKRT